MIQDLDLLVGEDFRTKANKCIHCGMCLMACPTYSVFGTEMDSPRGRLALMRAAAEGRIDPEGFRQSFSRHIMLCLACRSCEAACPSGVEYGILVEAARVVVEHNRHPSWMERFLRWFGTQQLMPRQGALKLMARLIWLYEVTGLQKLVRAADFLPKSLKAMEGILPPVVPHYADYSQPAPAQGERQGRVLFFTGCIQEAFLSPVNEATVRVLQRNGYEVVTPPEQTCCGAAHVHMGDLEKARELARQNLDAFISCAEGVDAIICNAGGCGTVLKEYSHLLEDDPEYGEKARGFVLLVRDISEFLVEHLREQPQGRVQARVTYSDSCHLRNGQKVIKQPRDLLRSIPGLEYVELSAPELCCGSAGVYNIVQVDTANAILDAKMEDIAATGAELIITSNTGCQMQLIAGTRRAGLDARVMHVVEVLEQSYQAQPE